MKTKSKSKSKRPVDYVKCRTVGIVELAKRVDGGYTFYAIYDPDTGDDILSAKLKNFRNREVTVTIELGDKLNQVTRKQKRQPRTGSAS